MLALRDLVNTPLQILVMAADLIKVNSTAEEANTIELAVARLRELIGALPTFDAAAHRPDALAFHGLDAIADEVRRLTTARAPARAAG